MRTKRSQAVFSSEPLAVKLPGGWGELTPAQFRAVCSLLSSDLPQYQFDSLLFFKLTGVRPVSMILGEDGREYPVVKHKRSVYLLKHDVAAYAIDALQWVHETAPLMDLSGLMASIDRSHRNLRLSDCKFGEFISADSNYSGYLATEKPELADRLFRFLWPRYRKRVRQWMRTAAVIWFAALKDHLVKSFSFLYQAPDPSDIFADKGNSPEAVKNSINAQIRALTKGDITMEEKVLGSPLYRALTELDQLAKEYQELKKIGN